MVSSFVKMFLINNKSASGTFYSYMHLVSSLIVIHLLPVLSLFLNNDSFIPLNIMLIEEYDVNVTYLNLEIIDVHFI